MEQGRGPAQEIVMTETVVDREPDVWEASFEGKRVVIGLGNEYMRDDGVGIRVAKEVRGRNLGADVLVYEYLELELSLLWRFREAAKLVVVDALSSGGSGGTISTYSITPRDGPLLQLPSLHSLRMHDVFDLANRAGALPCPLTIVGVEPEDCSPGEGLTEAVASAIPRIVDTVVQELGH